MNYIGDAAVMMLTPATIQVHGTKMQKKPKKTLDNTFTWQFITNDITLLTNWAGSLVALNLAQTLCSPTGDGICL